MGKVTGWVKVTDPKTGKSEYLGTDAPDGNGGCADRHISFEKDGSTVVYRPDTGTTTKIPSTQRVEIIEHRGCFLTTACIEARGLPDNCHELETLRAFRDKYLTVSAAGRKLVEVYYKVAPSIVDRINTDREKSAIVRGIYDVVQKCVRLIDGGKPAPAMREYSNMVHKLGERYGLERLLKK